MSCCQCRRFTDVRIRHRKLHATVVWRRKGKKLSCTKHVRDRSRPSFVCDERTCNRSSVCRWFAAKIARVPRADVSPPNERTMKLAPPGRRRASRSSCCFRRPGIPPKTLSIEISSFVKSSHPNRHSERMPAPRSVPRIVTLPARPRYASPRTPFSSSRSVLRYYLRLPVVTAPPMSLSNTQGRNATVADRSPRL